MHDFFDIFPRVIRRRGEANIVEVEVKRKHTITSNDMYMDISCDLGRRKWERRREESELS